MYKVYVAGAITGDSHTETFGNIGHGIKISAKLLKEGHAPFCPFLDYQFLFHENITIDQFYSYSLEFLKVCDIVLVIGRPSEYRQSIGTQKEIATARELDIPIVYDCYIEDSYLKEFKDTIETYNQLSSIGSSMDNIVNVIVNRRVSLRDYPSLTANDVKNKRSLMSIHGGVLQNGYRQIGDFRFVKELDGTISATIDDYDDSDMCKKIIIGFALCIQNNDIDGMQEIICSDNRKVLNTQIEAFYNIALQSKQSDGFYMLLRHINPSYQLVKKIVKDIESFDVKINNIELYYKLKIILTKIKPFIPDFSSDVIEDQVSMVMHEFDKYIELVEYKNVDFLHYYTQNVDCTGEVSKFYGGFLRPPSTAYKTIVKSDNKNLKAVFRYIDKHNNKDSCFDFLNLERFDGIIKDGNTEAVSDYLRINGHSTNRYVLLR